MWPSFFVSQVLPPSFLPCTRKIPNFTHVRESCDSNPLLPSTHSRFQDRNLSDTASPSHQIPTMSTSKGFETFPLEVWLKILDYSTPRVHRAMSQLSSAFHEIARKRLYHTLVFGNQVYRGITRDTAHDATWCRDLQLFHQLHKGRDD
jgi:hypothetical protein